MIKILKIINNLLIIIILFFGNESCKRSNVEITDILTNRTYRYWRICRNGIESNNLVRFDIDGSCYWIAFDHESLQFNLRTKDYNSIEPIDNFWFIKKDSIYFHNKFYFLEKNNTNTDSCYLVFHENHQFSFLRGKTTIDTNVHIFYVLRPFKSQADYLNFDSIKETKGVNKFDKVKMKKYYKYISK